MLTTAKIYFFAIAIIIIGIITINICFISAARAEMKWMHHSSSDSESDSDSPRKYKRIYFCPTSVSIDYLVLSLTVEILSYVSLKVCVF
jgi:hypothetical protein